MPDSVETWIDALAAVFEVDDGRGSRVRSFRVFERNELPAAITATMAPCAVSYVTDCRPYYSTGGPTILFWSGQTDFHLTGDVKPANVAYILPFYGRILASVMGHITLGGLVESFMIPSEEPGVMQFVTYRNKEGQDDHQGLVVKWEIKQPVSGQYVIEA